MNHKTLSLVLVPAALLGASYLMPASSAAPVVAAAPYACPTVVQGDMNGDGVVTLPDVHAYYAAHAAGSLTADWNLDGSINIADTIRFITIIGNTLPSSRSVLDFNLDGFVTGADLSAFSNAWMAGNPLANVSFHYGPTPHQTLDVLDADDAVMFFDWYMASCP